MRSSLTTRRRAVGAGASSARTSAGRVAGSVAIRSRAAADQRAADRASHAPAALPGVRDQTTASLPAGVGGSAFGPRLRAAIVTLTARNRISRRGIAEVAGELFGARLSTGSVDAICQHASAALAVPHSALRDWILVQDTLHVDETGWRTAGDSRALWTATTDGASIFEIAEHCNREQFNELIGDYAGIIVSDRWPGYEHLNAERRQVCWSHLQRDFRRHSEGLAEQKTFGEQGLELAARVFAAWRAYQHEHHDRDRLPPRSHRSRPSYGRCCSTPVAKASAPGYIACSPTTCSRSGPRYGPSPPPTTSSRPTTPPNAPCAAQSSTENSRTAPITQRRTVRRTRPLRRRHLPPTTTLPIRVPHANCSPPTPAATRSQH